MWEAQNSPKPQEGAAPLENWVALSIKAERTPTLWPALPFLDTNTTQLHAPALRQLLWALFVLVPKANTYKNRGIFTKWRISPPPPEPVHLFRRTIYSLGWPVESTRGPEDRLSLEGNWRHRMKRGRGWGGGGWKGGLQCQEPGEEWHFEQKNFSKRHSWICEFGTPIPRNLTASQWKNLHCENGESKGEETVAGHALLPGATPSARNLPIQSPASTRFACTFHLPSSASSLLGIRYLNSEQHRFPSQVRTKDGNPLARRQSRSFFWVGDKNDWIGVSCLKCSGNLYPSPCSPASVSFSVPPVVSRISPLSVVSGPPLQVGNSVTIMRTRLALDRAAGQSSSSSAY